MSKNFSDKKSRSIKKRSMTAAAVACAVVFVFLGCDRQSRYEILTFFFEGVPPLDGDPNAVGVTASSTHTENGEDTTTVIIEKPKTPAEIAFSIQKHHSSHKILKDCDKCHEGSLSSGRRELRKPLPDMCYSCHKDFSRSGKYLHGPINVGECVFCHDPHRSSFVKLQKDPQPKLCYNCHRRESISEIKNHEKVLDLICTNCHDPHASSQPKLLKPNAVTFNDPNQTDSGEDTNTVIIEK